MEHKKLFYDMMREFGQGMFVSRSTDGKMHGRPMYIAGAKEEEGLWFFSEIDSPKVDEIKTDSMVAMTFQSNDTFLSLCGTACITKDKAKMDELWEDSWATFFPQGKNSQNMCLIQLEPIGGEYWDRKTGRRNELTFEDFKKKKVHLETGSQTK